MVLELHRAILFVKDLDRMTEFYTEGFGLRPDPSSAEKGWIVLESNVAALGLHVVPPAIGKNITIDGPPKARQNTPTKLCFCTDDINRSRHHLITCGAHMFEVKPWGCDGIDPEGNVFQINQM
jgi:predicted enzyme related to lactoylglutathione lyase